MHTLIKILTGFLLVFILFSCTYNSQEKTENSQYAIQDSATVAMAKTQIIHLLDSFNIAAANADFNSYFNYFAEDAVFIGTDAAEYWTKPDFMLWAKPHFDCGKTWDFKAIERHIYFSPDGNIAWFDELLNTQMKICRGSGVLIKHKKNWKIKQYVLSMTIPNSQTSTIVKLKAPIEDEIIKNLTQ
ncbi:MAG: nuclear transport factor 2 family protein [Bacteroidales bacterium]|nr:nuclear transport factor 2 family protein [Bacteroidales bacterium]